MPINNEGWIGYHGTQYNGNVSRLKIEGGWLYQFQLYDKSPSICFVPDPTKSIWQKLKYYFLGDKKCR